MSRFFKHRLARTPPFYRRAYNLGRTWRVEVGTTEILRDAVDEILVEHRALEVFGYHGTYPRSGRAMFLRSQQTSDLLSVGAALSKEGVPQTVDRLAAAAIYPHVENHITPEGDLKGRPAPAYGCFGVTFWRAMDLKCAGCPIRDDCDAVVSYRLTFGGRSHFDDAIAGKAIAATKWDTKARAGKSQGYQREAYDPDIRILRSVYTAYWYASDTCFDDRVARLKKKAARQAVEEARASYFQAREEREAAAYEEFENECYEQLGAALESDGVARIWNQLNDFFRANSSTHRWRKRGSARMAIAFVEVGRQAVHAAAAKRPDWGRRATTQEIFEIAEWAAYLAGENVEDLAADMKNLKLDYHSTSRHLETLKLLKDAGLNLEAVV